MPIQTISYLTIINTVKNWIKTNCQNVANYNGMHGCVKNNYVITIASKRTGSYTETAKATTYNGLSGAISAAQVDSDMNSFINYLGNPSGNVTADNFYSFINNMAAFCFTNVAYINAPASIDFNNPVKYFVYKPNNTVWRNIMPLPFENIDLNLIDAVEINLFWQNIIKTMSTMENGFNIIPIQLRFEIV